MHTDTTKIIYHAASRAVNKTLLTNQRVSVAVDVYNAPLSVFDEVDHSEDEIVDRKSLNSAEQWTQVVGRLQRVTLHSPSLTKRAHQEPVKAPPGVQITRSIQAVLAFRWIHKVKIGHFELESDSTFITTASFHVKGKLTNKSEHR